MEPIDVWLCLLAAPRTLVLDFCPGLFVFPNHAVMEGGGGTPLSGPHTVLSAFLADRTHVTASCSICHGRKGGTLLSGPPQFELCSPRVHSYECSH